MITEKRQSMTKKDYVLIAESFWRVGFLKDRNQVRESAKQARTRAIAVDLAYSLKNENPRFDPDKFLKTCGIEG